MSETLTITVTAGGDDTDARAFRAALGDILDVLDALTKQQLGRGQPAIWHIVGLSKNSPPQITLECRQDVSVVKKFLHGYGELERKPSRPFPPLAMRATRRLGRRLKAHQIDGITIESPGLGPISPTVRMAENADKAISEKHYVVPSSVDGKLDVVNVHHRTRFSVFDDVSYREVRCHFPERLFEKVKRNLGKRVSVVGDVQFDANTDRPRSIKVEDIEPLDEGEVNPKLFSEMPTIDLAPGISSEEYIRRMRDGG